jgi:hypothetical protein
MTESSEIKNDDERADSPEGKPGDVEAAGETTAAAAISGPPDTRPVGADTLAKVEGERGDGRTQ